MKLPSEGLNKYGSYQNVCIYVVICPQDIYDISSGAIWLMGNFNFLLYSFLYFNFFQRNAS